MPHTGGRGAHPMLTHLTPEVLVVIGLQRSLLMLRSHTMWGRDVVQILNQTAARNSEIQLFGTTLANTRTGVNFPGRWPVQP